jgi:hypothetical protein
VDDPRRPSPPGEKPSFTLSIPAGSGVVLLRLQPDRAE